jgi:hypothetical protein
MVFGVDGEGWTARVLRLDAVLDGAVGVLLILGTWDGLYLALDLPHMGPALLAQLGGAALLGFAYLLWTAPRSAELGRTVALASAIVNALGASIIAAWLVVRSPAEIYIGTQGVVELAAAAVVLAAFALAEARIVARLRSASQS